MNWRRIKSQWERWYPLLWGIASFACYWILDQKYNLTFPNSLSDIFATSTTLSGIIVGFLITAKSILFSINETHIVKRLKKRQLYSKLINYFMFAIKCSFLLSMVSIVGLFIDFTNPELIEKAVFSLWVLFLFMAGSSCYRVIDVFAYILQSTEEEKHQN
jgi:hypothetical protein